MYLIYINESYDATHFAYSALFVPAFEWNRVFEDILKWRRDLFDKHNIPLDYELHATDFVGGRGEPNENRDKTYRAGIFASAFTIFDAIEGVSIINGITDNKKNHMRLFEYILNRINRTLETYNAYGILVCDEGNESSLVSIVRKMKKENIIPSSEYYRVSQDQLHYNVPLERIIEDPLFKTSKSSYFIQLADFIALGLLRNEKPLEKTLNKVQQAFNNLDKTLVRQACTKDHKNKGIVRV